MHALGLGRVVHSKIINQVLGEGSEGSGLRSNHGTPAWCLCSRWSQLSGAFSKIISVWPSLCEPQWGFLQCLESWNSISNKQLTGYQRVMMFSHYQLGLDFNWWPRGESLYIPLPAIASVFFFSVILFAVMWILCEGEIEVGLKTCSCFGGSKDMFPPRLPIYI